MRSVCLVAFTVCFIAAVFSDGPYRVTLSIAAFGFLCLGGTAKR